MTTVDHRPIGLPAPTRTHNSLPMPSTVKAESLPVKNTAAASQALPGSLPQRSPGLPARSTHRSDTARGLPGAGLPGSLPQRSEAPAAAPVAKKAASEKPAVEKSTESLPARTEQTSLPSFPRKTIADLPAKMDALPAPAPKVAEKVAVEQVAAPVQALPVSKARVTQTAPVAETVKPALGLPIAKVVAEASADGSVQESSSGTKRVGPPSVKAAVKKARVDNKMSFRPTPRDLTWLSCIYRYGLVTTNHIAFLADISPDSARKRLTVLYKQGLIRHDARRSARVWQITQTGIDFIRERGKVGTKFPSLLKYPHTMAIATIGITLEKGGPAAAEIVGNLLSEAPRVIITEKEMQVMEGRRERSFIMNNWNRLVDDLMHDEKFPVHPYDSVVSKGKLDSWTKQDWEAFVSTEVQEKDVLEARFRGPDTDDRNHTGYCHIVTSHNPKFLSNRPMERKAIQGTTTHRPDALIVLPNIVNGDGTVSGGSIAIEIELNNKSTKTEYKNTILHQWSSRVYSKVFWYFDDSEAKRMFREAMKELAAMHNPPFTMDEAKDYFRPFNLVLLNADLDAHGLYG